MTIDLSFQQVDNHLDPKAQNYLVQTYDVMPTCLRLDNYAEMCN